MTSPSYVQTDETRVNTTGYNASSPTITELNDGGYVITWYSYNAGDFDIDIYAQRYDASGAPVGTETRINTTTDDSQYYPTITGLTDGGYVISWVSSNQDGSGDGIYAQRYNASGASVGDETRINTTTSNSQLFPTLTGLNDGGYVITWYSFDQDGSGSGVYAQRYNASGATVGGETLVNTTTLDAQFYPSVASLKDGGYVIAWMGYSADGSSDIYAQRYAASGATVGDETLINTTTFSSQQTPQITGLSDGGYVITWTSYAQDGSGYGIYAQRYDASGATVGDETRINTSTDNDQHSSTITALSDGGYVITWMGVSQTETDDNPNVNYDIYAQRYDAASATLGTETLISTTTHSEYYPTVAGLTDGSYVVTWMGVNQSGSGSEIYQTRFSPPSLPVYTGDNGPNTLYGSDGADMLIGKGGNDTYYVNHELDQIVEAPNGGTDLVYSTVSYSLSDNVENLTLTGLAAINATGNAGNNFLRGNDAANILIGGAGDDLLFGQLGRDTASYENASSGVTVDLSLSGKQNTVGAGWDTLNSIENLTGSAHNDVLRGHSGHNILNGGDGSDLIEDDGGNDILNGGGGDDTLSGGIGNDDLNGGAGKDTASYASAASGVKVDLGITVRQDTLGAGFDYLSGIENLIGSSHNDVLKGKVGASVLTGGAGSDQFVFLGPNKGVDQVTDFARPQADQLVFAGTDYGFAAGHALVGRELVIDGFANGSGPQFLFNSANHTLYWDADGKNGAAAIKIAVLDNVNTLSADDFLFV